MDPHEPDPLFEILSTVSHSEHLVRVLRVGSWVVLHLKNLSFEPPGVPGFNIRNQNEERVVNI